MAYRFRSVGFSNKVAVGVAFCEPYQAKQLTFWSGHRANQKNNQNISNGFNQCLFDHDGDGVFDDANGDSGYLFKSDTPSKHQYCYESLALDGEPEIGCPRLKIINAAIDINEHIWLALSDDEKNRIKEKGNVDVIPTKSERNAMSTC